MQGVFTSLENNENRKSNCHFHVITNITVQMERHIPVSPKHPPLVKGKLNFSKGTADLFLPNLT